MDKIEETELDSIEEELDEPAYVEFDISTSPSDQSLELLAKKVEDHDIIIPYYQRRYVWKIEQASRLIESFLMGLPVPQVFLYENDENQLEVIDGQQRIMSVKYFFEGYFGEANNQGKRQVFKLKGLSERSEYNNKSFTELTPRDQRKLKNSTLRAIHIKQLRPSAESDSVFHIFQRLNTGGTQLKPQEIRNAVYRGNIVNQLTILSSDQGWQKILGIKKPHQNQKDVELVLRLFSLFRVWDEYEKPMLHYLNKAMKVNRSFDSQLALDFRREFPRVVKLVNDSITKPFRPRGVLNAAVLEAVFITLLEHNDISGSDLKIRYDKLLNDDEFMRSTTGGTTDTLVLKRRLATASEILTDGQRRH